MPLSLEPFQRFSLRAHFLRRLSLALRLSCCRIPAQRPHNFSLHTKGQSHHVDSLVHSSLDTHDLGNTFSGTHARFKSEQCRGVRNVRKKIWSRMARRIKPLKRFKNLENEITWLKPGENETVSTVFRFARNCDLHNPSHSHRASAR